MDENEVRDVILVQDDDGNELSFAVLDYFFYDGEEYAVLTPEDADIEDDDTDAYLMKIELDGDDEVFVPVPSEDFEAVSEAYLTMSDEDEEEL